MNLFLITYDLNNETSRPPIVNAIQGLSGEVLKLSESSYALHTNLESSEVYERLEHHIDNNDVLLIMGLTQPLDGYAHHQVIQWLQGKIPAP